MTSTGKTILGIIVLIILAGAIWYVSKKPASSDSMMPAATATQQDQSTQTPAGDSMNATATSQNTSDQSITQDMTTIDAQMQGFNSDASAASSQ
jgi:protein-disulfide isomerase